MDAQQHLSTRIRSSLATAAAVADAAAAAEAEAVKAEASEASAAVAGNISRLDDFGLLKENLAVLIRILRSVCYISKAKNPTINILTGYLC